MIAPCDRMETLRDWHEQVGHVGIGRLYELIRDKFTWQYLYEDCKNVVKTCVACQKLKAKPRSTPLKPTMKGEQPF